MGEHDFPRDYVALDLETTGFYPDSCRITEIGAVRVRGGAVVDRFQQLIDPLKPIPARITQLTGIDGAMVAGQPPIEEARPRFLAWLGADGSEASGGAAAGAAAIPVPVVGHNVGFDIRFLDHASRRVAGRPFACVDYDTMQISRTLFPGQRRHRLVDLIQRFGIADTEEHRALSDAIQTYECLEWMRGWVLDRSGLFADEFRWTQVAADDGTGGAHRRMVRV